MFSLRQLQAFFWAARLSSFAEAAGQLHISQSALSKRIAELELVMGREVFDRSSYRPALTHFGRSLLERAGPILSACDDLYQFGRGDDEVVGNLAFGLTELVALTWLPHAVAQLRLLHPKVVLEPHVDRANLLLQRIRKGQTSLGLLPALVFDEALHFTQLAEVEFSLMASPALVGRGTELRTAHLASHPILTQAAGSNAARLFDEWAASSQLDPHRVLATNSLTAIAQLVLAGVGIGFLPRGLFQPLLASGRLLELSSLPPARMHYHAVRRKGESEALVLAVEQVLVSCCDFQLSSYAGQVQSVTQ